MPAPSGSRFRDDSASQYNIWAFSAIKDGSLAGCDATQRTFQSDFCVAKEGIGTQEILEAIVRHVPPPRGLVHRPLRALVFDSKYDAYKGVIAYVRIMDGAIRRADSVVMMQTESQTDVLEVGYFSPGLVAVDQLSAGEVGYVATGFKNVKDCQVGDTITLSATPADTALEGYRPAKPMVFAGIFPVEGDDYPLLRDALDRLKLNDASLIYEPRKGTTSARHKSALA